MNQLKQERELLAQTNSARSLGDDHRQGNSIGADIAAALTERRRGCHFDAQPETALARAERGLVLSRPCVLTTLELHRDLLLLRGCALAKQGRENEALTPLKEALSYNRAIRSLYDVTKVRSKGGTLEYPWNFDIPILQALVEVCSRLGEQTQADAYQREISLISPET